MRRAVLFAATVVLLAGCAAPVVDDPSPVGTPVEETSRETMEGEG